MGLRINIPPAPQQEDVEAVSTWNARIRDAILKTGQGITWLNLNFTGSNLTDIVTRNHNDLQSIQGGVNGSRYHLTGAQHTDLTDGTETNLHYHASDRNSDNFTGTEWVDLTDGGTTELHSHPVAYGGFYDTTTQTLATINTATVISFNTQPLVDGITLVSGTRVTVPTTGIYTVDFSAQITTTSASTKTVYFWPRVNGVDATGATIRASIANNSGYTQIVSRSATFGLTAGDYIEAVWASDSISLQLEAFPATAFCPATPSVSLSLHQVK